MERKKASVCKETVAVSVTNSKIVHKNQNTLPPRLLSQPYHEVEVCRGIAASEAIVLMGPFFDNRAEIRKVLARERLVNIDIRPSANAFKNETGCKARDNCLFPHCKVEEQPIKKIKRATFQIEDKAVTRMLWLL